MTTLRQLYDLQEVDLEIDRVNAQVAALNRRIQDEAALLSARQTLAQRREAVQQMRRQQALHTQAVQELREKTKDLERRLYGGSIRSIKEMEALQGEAKGYHEQARTIEDEELLPLMVKLEEEEAWIGVASAALAHMEQERRALVEQLTAEASNLAATLPGLQAKRRGAAAALATAPLSQYERLRGAKQGQAVARVEHGMCAGCRVMLPGREVQQARISKEPVYCPSCGRMLYAG
ncbi:MAG: hypothetical protein HYU30_06625 [Chloroflexi bacterium]|nr:hypothetical protein [Chloroflexota bacterium]